jgi:glycerol-1-phosphate dehydrogenase [NAD(P)+]
MVTEGKSNFSKSKSMELPRHVVIGHDVIDDIGDVLKKLKLENNAIIVADENTKEIAGEKVSDALKGSGVSPDFFIIPDATMEVVRGLEKTIKESRTDFVLGVGGGKCIDVAKLGSYSSNVPFISIPTAASHDGLVSAQASISGERGKESIRTHTPLGVIMDTNVISHAPYRLLAAGCGDIISNSTAVKDWTLARNLRNEEYSNYAAALSEMTAQLLIENASSIKPGLEESAWQVSKALVSSGVAMSIAGSSRPASGSEHLFSHALDRLAEKPALHGEQCGVGTIMMGGTGRR